MKPINRRAFLKAMAVGLTGAALDLRVDQLLQQTAEMSDGDFITYITTTMNLWVANPSQSVMITDIADPTPIEPIGKIGEGMKYHFHCINCKITFHLNFMPRRCLWCGIPAKDPLPNFIDVDKLKGLAKQIHDVQGTLS